MPSKAWVAGVVVVFLAGFGTVIPGIGTIELFDHPAYTGMPDMVSSYVVAATYTTKM